MKKTLIFVMCVSSFGCATASKDISASYVSPLQYQNYDCSQIVLEMQMLKGKISEISGVLDTAANNDKAIATAGALLFWPALFALGGKKQQETELGSLKGQYDALQQVSVRNRCAI